MISNQNIRIAIRDSTDSFNIGFFDNNAGIKYYAAELTSYLEGTCSFLSIKYYSKSRVVTTGCKLAFIFKGKPYWLNVNNIKKNGYNIELIAYSLNLESTKEKRASWKAPKAMTFEEYLNYIDPEHSFELGINEVPTKRLSLEFNGQETILARLYSIANSFGAELEFITELNSDYSLKKHTINVYEKGNLGKDTTGLPIRVGNGLKVINYEENIDNFYTAIRARGKNGLTISGLNKRVFDDQNNLLYFTNGDTIYAPQARDRIISISHKTDDGYALLEIGDTDYETKEELYAYMLREIEKYSVPKVTYTTEGYVDGSIGDWKTLIDEVHHDPPLYVKARISEQTESLINTLNNKTTFTNFEVKHSEISQSLIRKMEEMIEQSKVYKAQIATDNTTIFKNNVGETTLMARVYDGIKDVTSNYRIYWFKDDIQVGTGINLRVTAADVVEKATYRFEAVDDLNRVIAQEEITITDVADGQDGEDALNGYLTLDNITLKADQYNNLPNDQLALAVGRFIVLKGQTELSDGVSYSVIRQTNATAQIDSKGNYHLVSLNDVTGQITFGAAVDGVVLEKTFTVSKVSDGTKGEDGQPGQDGLNPITGYLTNESIIILANNDGSVDSSSLNNANGYFNIYDGQTKVANNVVYSLVSQIGMSINLNASTGFYQVNSLSADFGTAILKAVYKGTEIQKQVMVVKSFKALGVVEGYNAPSNPVVGQLWRNTNPYSGYYGALYRYNGSNWSLFMLSVTNLNVDNLAAISANLGTVTSGLIKSADGLFYVDLSKQKIVAESSPDGIYHSKTTVANGYITVEDNSSNGRGISNELKPDKLVIANPGSYFEASIDGIRQGSPTSRLFRFFDAYQQVGLPWGLKADLYMMGWIVVCIIDRQVVNWQSKNVENALADETIPSMFAPAKRVTIKVARNAGSTIYNDLILYVETDGSIRFTNNDVAGNFVHSATVCWFTK